MKFRQRPQAQEDANEPMRQRIAQELQSVSGESMYQDWAQGLLDMWNEGKTLEWSDRALEERLLETARGIVTACHTPELTPLQRRQHIQKLFDFMSREIKERATATSPEPLDAEQARERARDDDPRRAFHETVQYGRRQLTAWSNRVGLSGHTQAHVQKRK